jgi:hypothetical protein
LLFSHVCLGSKTDSSFVCQAHLSKKHKQEIIGHQWTTVLRSRIKDCEGISFC